MLPKITIITPSYNQAEFIERTILSVLNQNYPNLEYIIIDGGSTDGSVEIIKKYQDQLEYWISESDKGTYDANNKALRIMSGDYWCVVNSDDILLPGALDIIAKTIHDNPNEKWIAGGVNFIDEYDHITGSSIPEKNKLIAGYSFLNGCWISHPTVFLHKTLIQEIGEFGQYHSMDLEYWLRLEKAGYTPYVVSAYIAGLRFHSNCKSTDKVKLQEEFIKVHDDFIEKNKLNRNPEIIKSKMDSRVFLYKILIGKNLVDNNRWQTIKLLIKIIRVKPVELTSVWFKGAIKRVVLGLKANDPLYKEYSNEQNRSNWNDLKGN
jgi:glycosyltransferase involved in cell wall biosynthesis